MKQIVIPAPIMLGGVAEAAKTQMTFADFFLEFLTPQMPVTNLSQVRLAIALCDKFEECKAGQEVQISDDEHEVLSKSLSGLQVSGRLKAKIMPCYEAIFDASEVPFAVTSVGGKKATA